MGQYFQVYNIDNSSPVRTSMAGKFGEAFWVMDNDTVLMNALWSPEPGYKRITTKSYSDLSPKPVFWRHFSRYLPPSPENYACKGLAQLSTELIDLIYEELVNLEDMACFAMTCQRLYEVGRRHLETFIEMVFTISWAGDRLICFGDYANLEDLPRGILTPEEIGVVQFQTLVDAGRELDITSYYERYDKIFPHLYPLVSLQTRNPDAALHELQAHYSKEYSELWQFWLELSSSGRNKSHPRGRASYFDTTIMGKLIQQSPALNFEQLYSGEYVLRNLITEEYVRGDAIRDMWETPDTWFLERLRFEHVLVFKITWSSDPDLAICYDGPIQVARGAWAGHCFDISGILSVQNTEEGDWKDVSRDILNDIVTVSKEEEQY
ncbi:hypothetical protein D9615_009015 [Tricholomella constricta]|uniref:F-box domain-containing protein n=1 Tax=Tricholomella constricta TaxID=117010 RepID=A0A8H5H0W2_9AGAR|nr:hypothetical protein D9615_009015 [Tricholomella constricta]